MPDIDEGHRALGGHFGAKAGFEDDHVASEEHQKAHIKETWKQGHGWNPKGNTTSSITLDTYSKGMPEDRRGRHSGPVSPGEGVEAAQSSCGSRREPMRYLTVLMVMVLVGCDDPVGPGLPPLATVDPLNTTLIDFNDAGQALWEIREVGFFLWNGSEVHELPFRARDLGPDGEVSWGGLYWKNGDLTNIEEFGSSLGIDGQGRVYGWSNPDEPSWWIPDDGIVGEAPRIRAGTFVSWVGEDGSVVSREYEGHDVFACYRHTLSGYTETPCGVVSMTENGLLAISWWLDSTPSGTQVHDTRTDPWTSYSFEFESWDMNDDMVFTATDGTVRDSTGNVLMELDAAHALINDNNEVLVISPEGHIRIIR